MRTTKLQPEEYYDDGQRKVNLWGLVVDPEEFLEDARQTSLRVMKRAVETLMEGVRDGLVGVNSWERSEEREDYRNGYYLRKGFDTAIGRIEGLRVPRCRKRSLLREVEGLMKRAKGAFEEQVVEMFLKGVSTRNVGQLLDGLIGLSVSAGQVSRLAKRLDAEVRRFHDRRLEDRYRYLFLDGIYLKTRSGKRLFETMAQARRQAVLVAYGVTWAGTKELIGFRVEKSESEAAWRRFLLSLVRRGFEGERLEVIVADGAKGIWKAVDDCYAEAKRQACWFHKASNVVKHTRVKNRGAVLRGLKAIYTARNRKEAEKAYEAWAAPWKTLEPEAVRCVERDLEALLVFYGQPVKHRRMLRTTNGIERCFREVRRRTRSIGCFLNVESLERLLYALFKTLNDRRAGTVCIEFRPAQAKNKRKQPVERKAA